MHALFLWRKAFVPSLLLLGCMSANACPVLAAEGKDTTPAPRVLGQTDQKWGNILTGNQPGDQEGKIADKGKNGNSQNQANDSQTATGNSAGQVPATHQSDAHPPTTNPKLDARERQAREAQAIFEESLRQMMPLSKGQIQEYRVHSDERDRALLPVSPDLNARTVRVSLEPGQAPVSVYTTANIATSLVFHDSTGQPWPVTSVTNGGPQFFQILRPELPEGNLLNIMPTKGYATSTIVVTLEGRDVPLVVRLESDSVRAPSRKADALVFFQLAHHGPRAATPILADIKETANSTMLAFLDQVPPSNAVRVRTNAKAGTMTVWSYNDRHYIRTNQTLMWPAWSAVVNGPGNTKCYEVPKTARVMLSIDGKIETVLFQNAQQ